MGEKNKKAHYYLKQSYPFHRFNSLYAYVLPKGPDQAINDKGVRKGVGGYIRETTRMRVVKFIYEFS